jgi:hypothetical protein
MYVDPTEWCDDVGGLPVRGTWLEYKLKQVPHFPRRMCNKPSETAACMPKQSEFQLRAHLSFSGIFSVVYFRLAALLRHKGKCQHGR